MSTSKFKVGEHYDEAFKGMTPKEIIDNLEGLAYGKEDGVYNKKLTSEELAVAKHNLADVSISIAKIEQEKKDAMDEFKDRLKEPTATKKELIEAIKLKSVRKEGILYYVDDQEDGMMYIFDEQGICIDERPLLAKERQTKMRQINKNVG